MEGSTPKVIENAEGMRTTPSFVGRSSDDRAHDRAHLSTQRPCGVAAAGIPSGGVPLRSGPPWVLHVPPAAGFGAEDGNAADGCGRGETGSRNANADGT